MKYKIKRVLQIVKYTIKITVVFFLGNGNQVILFLSWQLFVFISLAMQKYSKPLLTDTINIYFKF